MKAITFKVKLLWILFGQLLERLFQHLVTLSKVSLHPVEAAVRGAVVKVVVGQEWGIVAQDDDVPFPVGVLGTGQLLDDVSAHFRGPMEDDLL